VTDWAKVIVIISLHTVLLLLRRPIGFNSDQCVLLMPTQGYVYYGSGHAAVGLSMNSTSVGLYGHSSDYTPTFITAGAPTGKWNQVVVTCANKVLVLYVNGVPVGTNNQSASSYTLHPSSGDPYAQAEFWFPEGGGLGAFLTFNNNSGYLDGLSRFKGNISDFRVYGRTLTASEVAGLYSIESGPIPARPATGTATLANGFVIGVNLTDGGYGYTNTPRVQIIGGGGSGAQAVAVVSNGVVVAVNVLNAGYGYTSVPVVAITPPFIPAPSLGCAAMTLLSFGDLTVGGSYQLQRQQAWYWTNQGASFTTSDSTHTQMVAGAGGGNYRLVLTPAPSQAFATAQMVNGFVVGAAITSGGSGYVTAPAVAIIGGGGSNATAVAGLSGGAVVQIAITSAGIGYTNTPTLRIAAPPAASLSPDLIPVIRVDAAGLTPYENYQVQFKPALEAAWENWNGGLFSPTGVTSSQYLYISNNVGFFRLQYAP